MHLITLSDTILELIKSYQKESDKYKSLEIRNDVFIRIKDINSNLSNDDIIKVVNILTYK